MSTTLIGLSLFAVAAVFARWFLRLVVRGAEVALTHRLSGFISSLVAMPACREDDELRRLRRDIVRAAVDLHIATQCFNQASLAYHRVARAMPAKVVAKVLGFGDAMEVSPVVANLLLAAHRRRRRGQVQAPIEPVDTGEDTRFADEPPSAWLDIDLR